jgi:tRNA A-37 threonylcarbamoyl transferase component Bud32
MDSKNFVLENLLDHGKNRALIRVASTFNNQVYVKPLKYDNSALGWQMSKRRFTFASNDPDGEIKMCLLRHDLVPLPAVPQSSVISGSCDNSCRNQKETIARMCIPISLSELKQSKHIDRWYNVECADLVTGVPQVRISLDFNYHPSRLVSSVDSLNNKYDIEETIGTGVSIVKKAVNKHTKKEYAVKYLEKQVKGQTIPRSDLDSEIELLKSISHPNVVQLYETMEDKNTIYLIMELIKGSDLFDISDILGTLRPSSVAALLQQLLTALNFLHSRGIVHRDIKPENMIVDYKKNTLKLTDFGSAKIVNTKDEGAVAGTLNYMAPEVLLNMRGARNVCDKPVDVWSVGIITYMLLCGFHPFDCGKSKTQNIINRIISGKFDFPSPSWDKVPKDCKDFIKRCLVVDPKKRATVPELLKHPWIVKSATSGNVIFNEDECERIEREKSSLSSSRSSSMGSLVGLFSAQTGVSRS